MPAFARARVEPAGETPVRGALMTIFHPEVENTWQLKSLKVQATVLRSFLPLSAGTGSREGAADGRGGQGRAPRRYPGRERGFSC